MQSRCRRANSQTSRSEIGAHHSSPLGAIGSWAAVPNWNPAFRRAGTSSATGEPRLAIITVSPDSTNSSSGESRVFASCPPGSLPVRFRPAEIPARRNQYDDLPEDKKREWGDIEWDEEGTQRDFVGAEEINRCSHSSDVENDSSKGRWRDNEIVGDFGHRGVVGILESTHVFMYFGDDRLKTPYNMFYVYCAFSCCSYGLPLCRESL